MRVVINKKLMLALCLTIVLVGIVFATTTTVNSPVLNQNYSTTMNLTATTDLDVPLNVTFYYNATGGFAGLGSSILTTIINTTATQTNFNDTTYDISALADLATYNFSAYADNGTVQQLSVSAANVTIDNTVPNVTLLTIPASSASYAGSIVLNVTVNDLLIGMGTVFFNITNSTGSQNATYTATSSGIYYNATLDTTGFADGTYNITVWANDSLNNLNKTTIASNIIFDNTIPVVTLASTTTDSTSLTLSISVTDSAATTCAIDRSGASVSGTTITESGLSCGNTYAYVASCTDVAGNSGTSISTSFSTTACSGGGATSDGWTSSNTVSAASVLEGSSRILRESQRTQFTFGGATHYIGVKDISGEVVTMEIASDPIEYDFNIGDERKFDLNDDDVYDLYVKLNSVNSGVANVFIKIIEEADSYEDVVGVGVQDEEIGDDTSGRDVSEILGDIVKDGKSSWVVWLVLVAVIIAIVLLVWFIKNKDSVAKKKR